MKRKRVNNQGSTLLTVVIILAFIGILGSLMLSVTMTNLQMKMLERKSKENFYTCETTLDEIRAGLYEITVEETKLIYENEILAKFTDYIGETEENINRILKNKVSVAVIKKLGNTSAYDAELLAGELVDPNYDVFNTYLTPVPGTGNITRDYSIGEMNIISETKVIDGINLVNVSIIVPQVDVTLTKNDFESRIITDIIIDLPDYSFEDGIQTSVYKMEHPYKDYALIADGRITSDNDIGQGDSGINTINGSVYAGDGITVGSHNKEYHKLFINGANIVTREDISVIDTGKLTIKGTTKTDPDTGLPIDVPALVWAYDIVTDTVSTVGPSFTKPTTLHIDGISLIKDDLTLDAPYSDVKLDGAYVGYSATSTSLGSSIIVNGISSALNMYNLESLILAGRAHVSVDDNTGSTEKVTDIITGESLGVKSNQKAYLIPGKFITGINHNPVTSEDISNYDIPTVDFASMDSAVDIDYTNYVSNTSPLRPFKFASKQTVEGDKATILYYYYLAFISGKLADQYLMEYMAYPGNEGILDRMYPFSVKEILLPGDLVDMSKEVKTVGNMTSYKAGGDGIKKIEIHPGISSTYVNDEEANEFIRNSKLDHLVYQNSALDDIYTVADINSLYSKISHLLSLENSRVYKETDEVVASTVFSSGVDAFLFQDYPVVEYNGGPINTLGPKTEGKIIIVNGKATINYDFTGLMVVYGDVEISDNVEINGMIVAINKLAEDGTDTGNINVGNNATVNGKLVATGNIGLGSNNVFNSTEALTEDFFINHGGVIKNLFRNLEQVVLYTRTDPADNLVDLSSIIYYSNWSRQ